MGEGLQQIDGERCDEVNSNKYTRSECFLSGTEGTCAVLVWLGSG